MNRFFNMSTAILLVVVLCLSVIAACAVKPVTPEDYLQTTRAQVGAVYQTIGDLKAQGSITQAEAKKAIAKTELLENQVDLLDAAISHGNQATVAASQASLRLTLAALIAIQAELPKPKGKSP